MKKLLLAAALTALPASVALSQTSVTVYGIVDAGLASERGGATGPVNKLSSGIGSSSRLGFKGTEALGSGLSALFVLESGFKGDTGEADVSGSAFNRQAFVGLKSAYGTLALGRQYTSYYTTLVNVADPFGTGYAGTSKNLFPAAGSNTRTSNTVMIVTPVVGGLSAELGYAFGEQPGSNAAGRQFGAALGYANGPLTMRLAYLNHNNDLAAASGAASTPPVPAASRETGTNTLVAGNYDFGVLKAYFAYGRDHGPNSAVLPNTANPFGGVRPTASTDSDDMLVGVAAPFGLTTVLVSYMRKNDKTTVNQDADQWAIGALYAVSKRTSLYSSFARIGNKNGAGYTVGNNAEAGSGDRAINVGVRHSF